MTLKAIRIGLAVITAISIVFIIWLWNFNTREMQGGFGVMLALIFVYSPLMLTITASIVYLVEVYKNPMNVIRRSVAVVISVLATLATLPGMFFMSMIWGAFGFVSLGVILYYCIAFIIKSWDRVVLHSLPIHMCILMLSYIALLAFVMI